MKQARLSHAPSQGVAVGLLMLGLALCAQIALGILHLRDQQSDRRALAVLTLVALLGLAGLLYPVRPSRWPLSARQARNAALLWIALGSPVPLWLYYGQFPLGIASLAALPALVGAGLGWARQ